MDDAHIDAEERNSPVSSQEGTLNSYAYRFSSVINSVRDRLLSQTSSRPANEILSYLDQMNSTPAAASAIAEIFGDLNGSKELFVDSITQSQIDLLKNIQALTLPSSLSANQEKQLSALRKIQETRKILFNAKWTFINHTMNDAIFHQLSYANQVIAREQSSQVFDIHVTGILNLGVEEWNRQLEIFLQDEDFIPDIANLSNLLIELNLEMIHVEDSWDLHVRNLPYIKEF